MSINYSDLWRLLHGTQSQINAPLPSGHTCMNTFSFVLASDNESLHQELDCVISELKSGGILDALAIACQMNTPTSAGKSKQMARPHMLRAAVTGDIPPFDEKTPFGDPAGLYVQVTQLVANTLNAEVTFVPIASDDISSALLSHTVDFALWAAGEGRCTGELIHQRSIPEGLSVTEPFYSESWYAESAAEQLLSMESFNGVWSEILVSRDRRLLNAGVDHYIIIKDGSFARYAYTGELIERKHLSLQSDALTVIDTLNNKTVSHVELVDGMGGFKLTCTEGLQEGCVSFLRPWADHTYLVTGTVAGCSLSGPFFAGILNGTAKWCFEDENMGCLCSVQQEGMRLNWIWCHQAANGTVQEYHSSGYIVPTDSGFVWNGPDGTELFFARCFDGVWRCPGWNTFCLTSLGNVKVFQNYEKKYLRASRLGGAQSRAAAPPQWR